MKSWGKIVWAMALATGVASATSIRRDVRLELADIQNDGFKKASVVVFGNGIVQKRTCPTVRFRPCETSTVAQLSALQMDQIDRIIERARRNERLVKLPSRAMCLIASNNFRQYTADNGTLLLKRGHTCNGFTVNEALPARRLVSLLNRFNGGAEVEGLTLDAE